MSSCLSLMCTKPNFLGTIRRRVGTRQSCGGLRLQQGIDRLLIGVFPSERSGRGSERSERGFVLFVEKTATQRLEPPKDVFGSDDVGLKAPQKGLVFDGR